MFFATQPVVKEEDSFGNVITTDTTHMVTAATGSQGTSSLQGSNLTVTLNSGVATFSGLSYDKAETMNLAFTTNASGVTSATSNSIVVSPGATSHLGVTAPPSATAGTSFIFTVTALDSFNNTTSGYTGTVQFTSSDMQAVLPANSTLTNGVGNFIATLNTVGGQTLTAMDTVNSGINGTSGSITVSHSVAPATHFSISTSGGFTAGSPVSVTVTALDGFGNTVSDYAGTVHFTTSDIGSGST